MCFGDRGSVAPPETGDIHEIRVFSKERTDAVAIAAVPGFDKGLREILWCCNLHNGIASPFHISKQPEVSRDSASKRCNKPRAESSVLMSAASEPISVRTQPGW